MLFFFVFLGMLGGINGVSAGLGTKTGILHFGQMLISPKYSAPKRMGDLQLGQVKSMKGCITDINR